MGASSVSTSQKLKVDLAKYLVLMTPGEWYEIHDIARLRGVQNVGRLLHVLRRSDAVKTRGNRTSFCRTIGTVDLCALPLHPVDPRCWSTDDGISAPQAMAMNSLMNGSVVVVGRCFDGSFVVDRGKNVIVREDAVDSRGALRMLERGLLMKVGDDDFATYLTSATTTQ